jgi:NAD(P)-dependent dehydrogenase (short-subunit alcohol dehydrogenase family)
MGALTLAKHSREDNMTNIAMITGASGGLGRAVTEALVHEGWQLVLVSRRVDAGLERRAERKVRWIQSDTSTADGAKTAVLQCAELMGQPPTALVNCAGSLLLRPLHRTSAQQFRDCLRANLDTSFYSLQAFVTACLNARQPGNAVLISSAAARTGVSNHEAVAASKAGVEGLVRAAAASYARHRIRVNAVAPGLMRTPATEKFFSTTEATRQLDAQYPLGRHGQVGDAARAISWLLSDAAEWITGQILPVDGGFTAVRPLQRAG